MHNIFYALSSPTYLNSCVLGCIHLFGEEKTSEHIPFGFHSHKEEKRESDAWAGETDLTLIAIISGKRITKYMNGRSLYK